MNVRLSILLVIVLAIVGGSVVITQQLRTREPRDQAPWMYRVNVDDIAGVSVIHEGEHTDYALEDDEWIIKDGEDTQVFLDAWSGKVLILSGPRSSREVAEQIDDTAKYGLDSPQTRVTITDKSGSPLEFHLGDPTPNGVNWYAKLVASERLFTVDSTWSEVISKLATEPPYTPFKINVENINSMAVTQNDRRVQYSFEDDQWTVKDEDGEDAPVLADEWASLALLLDRPEVRRISVNEPEVAQYGLDSPQTQVQIIHKDSDLKELHLGDTTFDGESRYARIVGSNVLYTVAVAWSEVVSRLASEPPYLSTAAPRQDEAASTSLQSEGR